MAQSTEHLVNELIPKVSFIISTMEDDFGENISSLLANEELQKLYYHSDYLGSSVVNIKKYSISDSTIVGYGRNGGSSRGNIL